MLMTDYYRNDELSRYMIYIVIELILLICLVFIKARKYVNSLLFQCICFIVWDTSGALKPQPCDLTDRLQTIFCSGSMISLNTLNFVDIK